MLQAGTEAGINAVSAPAFNAPSRSAISAVNSTPWRISPLYQSRYVVA